MLTNMEVMPSLKLGEFILQFELGPPSPELQELARKQLRETPEIQRQAIADLRELLKSK